MSEIERLAFQTHAAPAIRPVRITGELHLPSEHAHRVPAMVLLTSSGGVQKHREHWYAAALNQAGIAALIIDSFRPRGITSTVADQRLVSAWEMENDAFAALAVLRHDERIDPARIGVMGVSKGGIAALSSAIAIRKQWRKTGDMIFALHVGIVPGCTVQHRVAKTTGKPILFLLAEKDDYTPAPLCLAYAEKMRASGADVTVKIYRGAHHGWEAIGPLNELRRAENYSHCRALMEDDGRLYVPQADRHMSQTEYSEWARLNCMYIGRTHAGGGTVELRQQATDDLLQFLQAHAF